MNFNELTDFLNEKTTQYNRKCFIESDPVQVPHAYSKKEDIEISGFLTATIAWGNRKMIIKNADRMLALMDHSPYDFILHHTQGDLKKVKGFVHRTFKGEDLEYFIRSLQNIYQNYRGLEPLFQPKPGETNMKNTLGRFRKIFFKHCPPERTYKHVSNALKGSSCKRLIMYLRWMVRQDSCGVDFGLWKTISPAKLTIPLDVHSGRVARKLGIITRKANDWKALEEIDVSLRKMDAKDPAKYDYALFGLGVFEGF